MTCRISGSEVSPHSVKVRIQDSARILESTGRLLWLAQP